MNFIYFQAIYSIDIDNVSSLIFMRKSTKAIRLPQTNAIKNSKTQRKPIKTTITYRSSPENSQKFSSSTGMPAFWYLIIGRS